MKWFSKNTRASSNAFNVYIFEKPSRAPWCYCIISRRNGLFSFIRMSRRVQRAAHRCCTLHFSTSHTESHMLAAAAAAATANPRHRCIIPNAEGIETMAHWGQPSWAGRLPVHRLQFRFAILNSPGDEYTTRGA